MTCVRIADSWHLSKPKKFQRIRQIRAIDRVSRFYLKHENSRGTWSAFKSKLEICKLRAIQSAFRPWSIYGKVEEQKKCQPGHRSWIRETEEQTHLSHTQTKWKTPEMCWHSTHSKQKLFSTWNLISTGRVKSVDFGQSHILIDTQRQRPVWSLPKTTQPTASTRTHTPHSAHRTRRTQRENL